MNVSRQQAAGNDDANEASERGPRARTKRLMLETATRLMQAGVTPSVSEVAEAAEVSRATAYRYFPSQAALVHAVVDEGLGPILTWQSASKDVVAPPLTLNPKSAHAAVPPSSFFTTFLTMSVPFWSLFVIVHVADPPAGTWIEEQFE